MFDGLRKPRHLVRVALFPQLYEDRSWRWEMCAFSKRLRQLVPCSRGTFEPFDEIVRFETVDTNSTNPELSTIWWVLYSLHNESYPGDSINAIW